MIGDGDEDNNNKESGEEIVMSVAYSIYDDDDDDEGIAGGSGDCGGVGPVLFTKWRGVVFNHWYRSQNIHYSQ